MTSTSAADLRSRELGDRLRAVMEAAGHNANQVAAALTFSPPLLSRMVTGSRRANPLRVAMILGYCQVPEAERAEIVELLAPDSDGSHEPDGHWVRPHRGGPPEAVATVLFAYRSASTIACCDPTGIPSLLRTDEFIDAGRRDRASDEADHARWAEVFRRHQAVMFERGGPSLIAYLHEKSLRAVPADVRVSQMVRLAMLIRQGRLRTRIVPADRDRAAMGAGFSLVRFADFRPAVCVPCDTVTVILEGPHHVAAYQERLAVLDTIALSEQDSSELIARLAESRTTEINPDPDPSESGKQ